MMGRVLSHQWSNAKPFTRRVRWYCADLLTRNTEVLLKFEDREGEHRAYYGSDVEKARQDYDRFKNGVTTTVLRRERNGSGGT